MSNWTDIKVSLPTEAGNYRVARQWSDLWRNRLVEGECFFNGLEFEDDLAEICGEIKEWLEMRNSDKEKMDVQSHLTNLASKVMQEWQDECIRDVDTSELNAQEIKRMITSISRCEFELDILLTQTDNVGGFGSSYPRKCLESLKLFRMILEMEIKGHE